MPPNATLFDAFERLYHKLRRAAAQQIRLEPPSISLPPTGLVHAVLVRLAGTRRLDWRSDSQLLRIASKAMRDALVDHARAKRSQKRGGGSTQVVLEEQLTLRVKDTARGVELLDLDTALQELASIEPRQAEVVQMAYFGGMSHGEIAAVLAVSERTVRGDLVLAKKWLLDRLSERERD